MFDEKHVEAAIRRLGQMSTKEIRRLRDVAADRSLDRLGAACDLELNARPFEFSEDLAARHHHLADEVQDLDLIGCIRHAFGKFRSLTSDEVRFIRWLHANPGGSYQDAVVAYGRGDLGLVIGHLVYDRFGCFRRFMNEGEDQSSVLLLKDRNGPSVRYDMRPEMRQVMQELGVI